MAAAREGYSKIALSVKPEAASCCAPAGEQGVFTYLGLIRPRLQQLDGFALRTISLPCVQSSASCCDSCTKDHHLLVLRATVSVPSSELGSYCYLSNELN